MEILLLITCSGYLQSLENCLNSSKLIIDFSRLDTKPTTSILIVRIKEDIIVIIIIIIIIIIIVVIMIIIIIINFGKFQKHPNLMNVIFSSNRNCESLKV